MSCGERYGFLFLGIRCEEILRRGQEGAKEGREDGSRVERECRCWTLYITVSCVWWRCSVK